MSQDTLWYMDLVYDFVIIGSGFGGSVSAMRLAQKGYKVLVLEKGRRFSRQDFAKTNWDLSRYLWAPIFKCFGIQQISLLRGVMVLHGAGVGGGSLVYANTLMEPREHVFAQSMWPQNIQWHQELAPFYQTAKKMLGVATNPKLFAADKAIEKLAASMGAKSSFHPTEVGVYFADADQGHNSPTEIDPYFQGQGPLRSPCTYCGACMVGCRVGAKNTLDQNYLYFAEQAGAEIRPYAQVKQIAKQADGSYEVLYQDTRQIFFAPKKKITAHKVILAAGVLGTLRLLLHNKYISKTLPNISEALGVGVRTNGESLCGVTTFSSLPVEQGDYSQGVAIGSAFHPDENTKIEPVRYSPGSDFLKFLAVPLTGQGGPLVRPLKLIMNLVFKPISFLRVLFHRKWSEHTVIILVMQSLDYKMNLSLGRSIYTLFTKNLVSRSSTHQVPSYLPIAQTATSKLSGIMKGVAQNSASEVLLSIPSTAHILGGANLATDAERGVVDINHQVFSYPGLYVCDGSVIPGNLGVNPSLTITALAERFVSQFPTKGA